jgi:hypothetical protein
MKGSFYGEIECIFNKFPNKKTKLHGLSPRAKYTDRATKCPNHRKILLGDFCAKVDKEGVFKPTIGNEGLYKISNDNGVVVNFTTSKNPSKVQCSHTITFINVLGYLLIKRLNNQINDILINRRHTQMYPMSAISRKWTIIMTILWWWQKLGSDWH